MDVAAARREEAASLTPSSRPQSVVVIGGGIVGVVTALTLQTSGHQVTLIEAGEIGMGCSYGNGGAISPDQCVPFAMPGMLKRVPRWLFDPSGPLVVHWAYLPKSLPWLARWIYQGHNLERVWGNSVAMRALFKSALADFETLLGDSHDSLVRKSGQLYVWQHERSGPVEELARSLREAQGVETRTLSAEQIRAMDPALHPRFRMGLYFPENGHTVDPLRMVQELARRFQGAGGTVLSDRFERFAIDNGQAVAAGCEGGRHAADAFVVATGIAGAAMASRRGDSVSMQAERGYHVMVPTPGVQPTLKVSNRDDMFGLAPMAKGLRISGTVEIASPEAPPDYSRAKALLTQAQSMYPGLDGTGAEYWMGSRPSTPDSLPIIDRAKKAGNVIYAFGHGHTGLTGAPMTARIVRSLIDGSAPPIDASPFRATRF